jgi:hypothetical protein
MIRAVARVAIVLIFSIVEPVDIVFSTASTPGIADKTHRIQSMNHTVTLPDDHYEICKVTHFRNRGDSVTLAKCDRRAVGCTALGNARLEAYPPRDSLPMPSTPDGTAAFGVQE